MSIHSDLSLRRRTMVSYSSLVDNDSSSQISLDPIFRLNSIGNGLSHDDSDIEDAEADVLYPQFKLDGTDDVDLDTFDTLVEEHTRKMSVGTLNTPSHCPQLYGEQHKQVNVIDHNESRYSIYNPKESEEKAQRFTQIQQLLSDEGRAALKTLSTSSGWWVDVLSPTDEEMRILAKTFRIHPLTTEDIQSQETREKVEQFGNYTFVCFRSFELSDADKILPFNFYILIFKEGLLTFHFSPSPIPKRVSVRADQCLEFISISPDWMNYALIDAITDDFTPVIEDLERESISIDELALVLRNSEKSDMLRRISRCRKKCTQMSRLLTSKMDVMRSLIKRIEDRSKETNRVENGEHRMFKDGLFYMGDIQDHIVTMIQNVAHCDRILHRAHSNYLAQANMELTITYAKTNEVMHRLTFIATIFLPMHLVGGVFGMNVNVPGQYYLDDVFFFWILAGITLYGLVMGYFGKRIGIL